MRRARHPLFLLAIAAVLAVTVVVALVGSSGPTDDRRSGDRPIGDDRLQRALQATRALESGRIEVTTTLTGLSDAPDPPQGGRVTVAVHRVAFDRRTRRVEVETDMSAVAGVLGAQGAAGSGGAGGAAGSGEVAPGVDLSVPARMVAVGDVVYAQGGPAAGALGRSPTDWVASDRAGLVDQGPDSDTAALVLDPFGPLDVVGDAGADIRRAGDGEVRGTPVTHLVGRVGADRGGGAAPLDMWIDADGVIRRLELRLTSGGAAGGTGRTDGEVVTTVELFDVGAPIDIEPPEPSVR